MHHPWHLLFRNELAVPELSGFVQGLGAWECHRGSHPLTLALVPPGCLDVGDPGRLVSPPFLTDVLEQREAAFRASSSWKQLQDRKPLVPPGLPCPRTGCVYASACSCQN